MKKLLYLSAAVERRRGVGQKAENDDDQEQGDDEDGEEQLTLRDLQLVSVDTASSKPRTKKKERKKGV